MSQPQVVPMTDDVLEADAPVVDEARIKGVHEEIQGMVEIHLDADPLAAGPKLMNNKKAAVRNQLSRCTQIELQILEDRGWFQRELTREQSKYNLSYTHLITHDPHVRSGRSAADREAAAKVRLAESVEKIGELELAVEDLERLHEVIKAKKKDLGNLQAQMRDQLKICEHELGLGSKWGATSTSPFPSGGQVTADDLSVVDDLIDNVDAESDEETIVVVEDEDDEEDTTLVEAYENPDDVQDEPEKIEDVLPSTASSKETDDALSNLEVDEDDEGETQDPSDVDVDAILNDLEYED